MQCIHAKTFMYVCFNIYIHTYTGTYYLCPYILLCVSGFLNDKLLKIFKVLCFMQFKYMLSCGK